MARRIEMTRTIVIHATPICRLGVVDELLHFGSLGYSISRLRRRAAVRLLCSAVALFMSGRDRWKLSLGPESCPVRMRSPGTTRKHDERCTLITSAHRRTFFSKNKPAIVLLIVRRASNKCAITRSFAASQYNY